MCKDASLLLSCNHADTARVIQKTLSRTGYTVALAETDAEARRQAAQTHFDAVVLDLGGPGDDYLGLLRDLTAQGQKVVALASFLFDGDAARLKDAGAEEWILKPFTVAQLEQRIESVCGRTPAGSCCCN